ncbi:MAG: 2-oxoacid:acceptor oxidoreductase subunit alpha [Planctomycetes bacterium]|nr:2-oxoacid:acceptor oxidoreductase subunit alpha [Planctomycetota bacterium]
MTNETTHKVRSIEQVVIRLAGDSGDGMQITGNEFTKTSAIVGNDLATLPDFPAEIRAPAGTLPGVSGFQIRFASKDIHTPGDDPDILVAMNPAALKVNLPDMRPGKTIIINTAMFVEKELRKALYVKDDGTIINPLNDHSLSNYHVIPVDLNKLALEGTKEFGLSPKESLRCKNFVALGMMYWLYSRPLEPTIAWLRDYFKGDKVNFANANIAAMKTGYNYAETAELFVEQYKIPAAHLPAGTYRNVMGNQAVALAIAAAAKISGVPVFYGSYPITPASDILHQISKYKNYGVYTFQAEDEIAAICSAIGASFAGMIGVTGSSGPGIALKGEAMGLAVMTELPLVIIDVQRGGPSTGLPTKTEQADLLQAVLGRNSEAPMPVVAASSPADCFDRFLEAVRIATKYMTPVVFLSDGYLANGSEPWRLPDIDKLPKIDINFRTERDGFQPYLRDPGTLARVWAKPGTPGLEHRIGGIEKRDGVGSINYDAENHDSMVRLRWRKIYKVADDCAAPLMAGPERGPLLVLGWGSTLGSITSAVEMAHAHKMPIARCHLQQVWPFPSSLGAILSRYDRILIPEMNLGQMWRLVRSEYAVQAYSFAKVQGRPFTTGELFRKIQQTLELPAHGSSHPLDTKLERASEVAADVSGG